MDVLGGTLGALLFVAALVVCVAFLIAIVLAPLQLYKIHYALLAILQELRLQREPGLQSKSVVGVRLPSDRGDSIVPYVVGVILVVAVVAGVIYFSQRT